MLSFVGGCAGVLLGTWGTALLVRLSPGTIPRLEVVGVDVRVLTFAACASLATGVLFGMAPALVAWEGGAHAALRERGRGLSGSRRGQRFRAMLMAGEVAMALILVVASGLTIRSFARLTRADTGVHADGVLTFHMTVSTTRFTGADREIAAAQGVLDALGRLPGVEAVGASTSMPPSYTQQGSEFAIEGAPAPMPGHAPRAWYLPATPGYLKALGIPLVTGRDFTSADDAKSVPVTIVNRELMRRQFLGANPIGRRISVEGVTRTIVGVAGDAAYDGVGAPAGAEVYVPYAQSPFPGVWVAIKTAGDPRALVGPVRATLATVDPDMRPRSVRTMEEVLSGAFVGPRFQTWLLGMFGALALSLAAVGIYGVIAYGVAQRTGEIGLRLALGATRGTVLRLIVRQGMGAVAAGVIAGAGGALLLSRVMTGLLYSVRATDLATYAAATVLIIVVALAASYLPARRATRVDPLEAMRSE